MLLTDKDGLSGITSTADHTGRCWADCASTPLTLFIISFVIFDDFVEQFSFVVGATIYIGGSNNKQNYYCWSEGQSCFW